MWDELMSRMDAVAAAAALMLMMMMLLFSGAGGVAEAGGAERCFRTVDSRYAPHYCSVTQHLN
jgi:hypothetical protein